MVTVELEKPRESFERRNVRERSASLLTIESGSTPKDELRWRDLPNKRQLAILALAIAVEQLAQSALQPYVFFQLRSFDADVPDVILVWQLALLQACYAAAQASTGGLWSRFADGYGKKTTLTIGSIGTLISCLGFGCSKSFTTACAFRALGGLLSGNSSVLRSVVHETIPAKKYTSRAHLLTSVSVNTGIVLGPLLGGYLTSPPKSLAPGSNIISPAGIWWTSRWPFLLPNIASATIVLASLLIVLFKLDESHGSVEDPVAPLDRRLTQAQDYPKRVGKDVPDGRQRPSFSRTASYADQEGKPEHRRTSILRQLFTARVLLALLAHFTTSLHLGMFDTLWISFISLDRYMPIRPPFPTFRPVHPILINSRVQASLPWQLPLIFTGGLGWTPKDVGLAISAMGAMGVTLQLAVSPSARAKYSSPPLNRLVALVFPAVYALVPYLDIVPSATLPPRPADGNSLWLAICGVMLSQAVGRSFVLPATMRLVDTCSPYPSVQSTIPGIVGTLGSTASALGPVIGGYVFGIGLDGRIVGLPWWMLAVVALFAVLTLLWAGDAAGRDMISDAEAEVVVKLELRRDSVQLSAGNDRHID